MIKIGVLTSSRAEYGLLRSLIFELKKDEFFDVKVLVTGAHLSKKFGMTYKEIEKDGIIIDAKMDISVEEDSAIGVSKSMSKAIVLFAEYFAYTNLDALIVLGDRFETLAVCCAAMHAKIPIIHLHGGETTEGAIDEAIRHSITKMSILHFTSNETHRKRVIQLGESPNRVFNVGAIGVENAMNLQLLSKLELSEILDVDLSKKYCVVTFHPETLEKEDIDSQFDNLISALKKYKDVNFIFTKSNADVGGMRINELIEDYCKNQDNFFAFNSLGVIKYLSAVKYSEAVIGNSSSGIIEVPSFKVPTINIGDRQKGRMQARSVINCKCDSLEIEKAIELAFDNNFRESINNVNNPYEGVDTTKSIIMLIKKWFSPNDISLKKEFYNIDFEV